MVMVTAKVTRMNRDFTFHLHFRKSSLPAVLFHLRVSGVVDH